MKVQHKNSRDIFDLSEPHYDKHWNSIYGYLTVCSEKILFFYSVGDIDYKDLTEEFEIVEE